MASCDVFCVKKLNKYIHVNVHLVFFVSVRSTVIGNPPEKISTGLLVGYILGVLLAAILIVASVIIVRRKR